MNQYDRRNFLKLSSLGIGSLMAPAVLSGCVQSVAQSGAGPAGEFLHGVASGDPLSNGVIIWTRVTPQEAESGATATQGVSIAWEVATDSGFRQLARRDSATVNAQTDYTLKVDLVGLAPATTYYYRFRSGQIISPVGVTRTLPVGAVASVKLAVMSCSNYPAGYFNVYDAASRDTELDAILHLGDYIYEYGAGGYATRDAEALGRDFLPGNDRELYSLDDYRRRYAQYRRDAGLQALHAAAPFICVWDDHEIANDTWKGGAQNHDASEGDFFERKRAALQAYFEWMPIRPVVEDNHEIIYRSFEFGELVNLMMLDTRLIGRDEQLDYAHYQTEAGKFAAERFRADINNKGRSLLGPEQRAWLLDRMRSSSATWQVLGQQLLMGRMNLPVELLLNRADPERGRIVFAELAAIKARLMAGDTSVTAVEKARVSEVLPYNLDAWDGYAVERELLLASAAEMDKNLIVVAGDTHNAWASDLVDRNGRSVGVEFATASVSSPGMEVYLQIPESDWSETERAFVALIDDLKYANVGDRGYLTVTFTQGSATANWQFIDNIKSSEYALKEDRAKELGVVVGQNRIAPTFPTSPTA